MYVEISSRITGEILCFTHVDYLTFDDGFLIFSSYKGACSFKYPAGEWFVFYAEKGCC